MQSVTVMQSSTEPKRHLVNGVVSPPLANIQNSTDAKRRLLVVNGFVSLPPLAKRQRVEMMGKEKALALRKKHVAYVNLYIIENSAWCTHAIIILLHELRPPPITVQGP